MKKIVLFTISVIMSISLFGAKYDHLYIVGSACEIGWDAGAALEMTAEADGIFKWDGILYGKDTDVKEKMRFKFLAERGRWDPGYTCEYINSTTHTLVELDKSIQIYEYEGNLPDGHDNAFQVAETARYNITVDLNANTMVVKRTGDAENPPSEPTLYDHLYVVGSGCDAGWSTTDALEMTPDVEGVFKWEGNLYSKDYDENGNARFKFLTSRNGWAPRYTCEYELSSAHTLVTPDETMPIYEYRGNLPNGHDNAFQIAETAKYRITIDLNVNTMLVTRLGDAEVSENPVNIFTPETFQATGGTLNYRKLEPLTVEAGKKYPLVIFMHGKGERGDNNKSQLTFAGRLFTTAASREAFPAYVLFPQCPSQYFWAFDQEPSSFDATTFPTDYPLSVANGMVEELIRYYLAMDAVDKDRVYIFGLSMGGMATFDMVCRFPELFTAAVPLCGGINVERLTDQRLAGVYWRIFHGDADGVVPVENSRNAYSKLQQLGADVEYIEVLGADHFVWTPAFEREDFLPWLFAKTRIPYAEVETVEADGRLQAYMEGDELVIKHDKDSDYQVYNTVGQLVNSGTLTDGVARVALAGHGIYVVRADEASRLVTK